MVVVGGGVKASVSAVENNRLQWDVFGKQRLGSCAIAESCYSLPMCPFLFFQKHSEMIKK